MVSFLKTGLSLLTVLILGTMLAVKSAYPQEIKFDDIGLGLNLALSSTPEEEELSDTGGESSSDKFELYFDWAYFRLGFNTSNADINFKAHNQSWDAIMTVNVIYTAFRISTKESDSDWDIYAMAGLAIVESELVITKVTSVKSGSIGYLLGGGLYYYFGDYGFGPQILVISADGDFDGIKVATGFTQLQLGFKYGF